jgi:hypothetical protein
MHGGEGQVLKIMPGEQKRTGTADGSTVQMVTTANISIGRCIAKQGAVQSRCASKVPRGQGKHTNWGDEVRTLAHHRAHLFLCGRAGAVVVVQVLQQCQLTGGSEDHSELPHVLHTSTRHFPKNTQQK